MAIGEYRRERYTGSASAGTKARTIVWGAVIAGVILAIAVQLMLGLLGLGVGLGALPGSDRSIAALASTAGIYSLIAALIGLFVGAFATVRFAGLAEKMDAILHGLVTWAVATLLVVLVLGGTASSVLGGAFGAVGSAVGGLASAAGALDQPGAGSDGLLPDSIRSDLAALTAGAPDAGDAPAAEANGETGAAQAEAGETAPAPVQGGASSGETLAAIAAGLSETASDAERQAAVAAIQQAGGLSRTAAEQRLASYQQSFDDMVRTVRQSADDAARAVASASFSAFVALLLGALVSVLGGFLARSRYEKA
ncbi:hypothetical protein U0C82_01135 [Fulvimarina sp. 2208YS6-2-32]|uniref:PhnA-like protein n=1 Tax=Fulvimarina uroteuthidis TaxID=3098149 RepID=A0ABU5I0P9_9HYPH|nr:hypothetical protein [Fulvimarina sp. 2208YS6-2-32]MDY8107751.1 hypothetical protein [Fulvimarina sp. 2208YS6-2-32]